MTENSNVPTFVLKTFAKDLESFASIHHLFLAIFCVSLEVNIFGQMSFEQRSQRQSSMEFAANFIWVNASVNVIKLVSFIVDDEAK